MSINIIKRGYRYLKRRFESFVYTMFYEAKFKIDRMEWGLNRDYKRDNEIIVSLTSIPSRLKYIHLSIYTILKQTVKPDRIILYLDEEKCNKDDLPSKLLELEKYGVEIMLKKDIRVHTKYYHAMKENPEAIIITIDDDILYRKDLIEILLDSYKKYPKAISCFRAKRIKFDNNGNLLPYVQWEAYCTSIKSPSHELVALGVEGVLYPPHSIISEVFNEDAIKKYSLKNDDIWLKMMELLTGTKVVRVDIAKNKKVEVLNTQKVALYKSNVGQNQNDVYIHNLLEAYNINLKDFM